MLVIIDNARYLNLDHDKLSKQILIVMVVIISCEILGLYLVYGTFCTKFKLEFIRDDGITFQFTINI